MKNRYEKREPAGLPTEVTLLVENPVKGGSHFVTYHTHPLTSAP